jgi:phosphomannomutase
VAAACGPEQVAGPYLTRLLQAANGAAPLRVGWDPGNGASGAIVTRLVSLLPGEHHVINGTIDGTFPAHHPDPSVAKNLAELQALVSAGRLDLGIAFDGDGDRIGVVDGDGEIVWPDQLLLLLARDVLRDRPGRADRRRCQIQPRAVRRHRGDGRQGGAVAIGLCARSRGDDAGRGAAGR